MFFFFLAKSHLFFFFFFINNFNLQNTVLQYLRCLLTSFSTHLVCTLIIIEMCYYLFIADNEAEQVLNQMIPYIRCYKDTNLENWQNSLISEASE